MNLISLLVRFVFVMRQDEIIQSFYFVSCIVEILYKNSNINQLTCQTKIRLSNP